MGQKKTLRWSSLSVARLQEIADYISQYSPVNARTVIQEIRTTVRSLCEHPEAHPLERHIDPNDGSYRYVLCHRYKIIYRIKSAYILILDVFHSSRNPDDIQKLGE